MAGRRNFATKCFILIFALTAIISISGCLGNSNIGAMISAPLVKRTEEIFKSPDTVAGRTVILEINGFISNALPASSLLAIKNSPSSGQFIASVTELDNMSKEIGNASVTGNKFSISINMLNISRSLLEDKYPVITVRDISTGIVIYQAIPGRIPKIYEMPAELEKLVLNNFIIDAESTARSVIAIEKGPPDIVLAKISNQDVQPSAIVTKDMAQIGVTEFETAIDREFGGGENTAQLTCAANAIAAVILNRNISPALKTDNIALIHESPETMAATFVKLINNPRFSATVINAGATEMNFSFTSPSGLYSFSINAQTPINTISSLFKGIQKTQQVTKPSISPPDMTSAQAAIQVEIACATASAVIKYTLDGTEPSKNNGILYSGPFNLTSSATVTAIATKQGMEDSDTATASFTIVPDPSKKIAPPAISPSSGTYNDATLEISFTSKTAGAIFIYTLDGSRPARNNGFAYTGPFPINSSSLVRVIAVSEGWSDSPESSAAFELKLHTPFFSPPPGTYIGSVEITIDCQSQGANIMYGFSVDGSEPSGYQIYNGEKIIINESTTIKAFAYGEGRTTSNEAEASYIIENPAAIKK